jgi:hypothetical protein
MGRSVVEAISLPYQKFSASLAWKDGLSFSIMIEWKMIPFLSAAEVVVPLAEVVAPTWSLPALIPPNN